MEGNVLIVNDALFGPAAKPLLVTLEVVIDQLNLPTGSVFIAIIMYLFFRGFLSGPSAVGTVTKASNMASPSCG